MRTARAVPTPWLCRKTMISRTAFCSAQAARMLAARTGPMPPTSPQSIRCCFDNVEDLFAEGAHQFFGIDRTNAADHAGGEVFRDAVGRSRGGGAQEPRFELLAVGPVVDPSAGGRDPLASRNGRGMANNGYDVTMSAHPSAKNAKTILGVVVGYSLDEARQHFLSK